MENTQSVAALMDSTVSKIQLLQKAFAELESQRAITLNMKWKQLEEHFHGLEKSLKRRFTELEDQEKEFETTIVQSKELLVKREEAVVAKERASLERLQKKRDAAVSAISIALEKNKSSSPGEPTCNDTEDEEGSEVVEGKAPDTMATQAPDTMASQSSIVHIGKAFESRIDEVKAYPQLIRLCQQMDAEGLHKFISENRKDLTTLREEIPIALNSANDPGSLILDSLKGFYRSDVSISDAKKDSILLGLRRSCIMLMECLGSLMTHLDQKFLSSIISASVKERAKAVAEEWKPMLDELDVDAGNGNSLEAHAFLQLLATFGIDSAFDKESLFKLIPMVSRRRQTADLCRSLGLTEKMPGVIDVLVNNGRHIDAVNLVIAFDLTKQFSPVSLLKSFLIEAKKVSSPLKAGNISPNIQNDLNDKELIALKAVIKCIEDHKLEEQYPLNPLQNRILQLEKVKADKKRATEVSKPQPKRPRANGAGYGPQRATNAATDKNSYSRTTDRYPPQYVYERPYCYPAPVDNHMPSFVGTVAYGPAPGHGNFFGNGFQYQAPFLH
ncbi:hypothetical protein Leryth_000806 [Lithospermum erythrorhizon]|nr:hypothetical protein Leryth_000806 [Lithospermum erythrorhizon]